MCGIAGFLLRDGAPAELSTVRAMCDSIRHRGPDDEGFHVDGSCALGMRRLSIIDLQTGHQPIANEDGSAWVVFNGEIYNFQELRQSLIGQNHHFSTRSDTETLIHLYEQEGVAGLERLSGMFAYAIWDRRKGQLLLVRDRFGKKPLYYAVVPHGIYFGSELKCLRAAGISLDLDPHALRLYFPFGYIPDPWSPFQQVRKLPPGCWLTCTLAGDVRLGRYWRLPPPQEQVPGGWSEREAGEQLRAAFDESVRTRLIADVPLGAFLSGGIDSSSVVASMALQTSAPVKTFSIGFEEAEFNELPYARLVAKQYQTDHHEIVVQPDSVALVSRLVRHFDEPFADSSAIPTFIVSEFAARHVKVVLTGDGGDELFAGYPSLAEVDRLRRFDLAPQPVRKLVSWLAEQLPYRAYGKNYLRMISRPSALDRYFELCAPRFLRDRLLSPNWTLPDGLDFLFATFPDALLPGQVDVLTQVQYFEATAKLSGDILVKVDRMSMANSLEVRCPLLDHRLAELAMRVPTAWKLRNGTGKQILLRVIGDRLPPALLTRSKMGFGVPLPMWFRGSLRDFLWDHLTDARSLGRGIVSRGFVRLLLQEHDSGRRNNYHWLWLLLMLELWFRDWEQACPGPVRPEANAAMSRDRTMPANPPRQASPC
jgi:asparagine synthase (glutamine-hydrolysing)